MSTKRQIQRNIDRKNKEMLNQYDPFLRRGWENKSSNDLNVFANLARNGITVEYLNSEIEKARKQAFADTSVAILKSVYACVALVLADEFGFTEDQYLKALVDIDHKMAFTIDTEEIIKEMEERLNIKFNYANGIERIESL